MLITHPSPQRKEREIVYWKFVSPSLILLLPHVELTSSTFQMGPNEVACTLCDRHLSRFSDLRRHYWGIHLKK